jgi:AcrR family transcriptional regulator
MARRKNTPRARDGIRDESLGIALEQALIQMPMSSIEVRALCEKAGVGRTTFYRYYGEKDGLGNLFKRSQRKQFEEYLLEHPVSEKENRDKRLLSYLYLKKDLLLSLEKFGEDGMLLDLLKTLVLTDPKRSYTYLDSMGVGLWYGFLKCWTEEGMKDSTEEVQRKVLASLSVLIASRKKQVK